MASSVYDFSAINLKGQSVELSEYKDKVLLIVNTASKCGLTPQYEGLEKLYKEKQSKGLEVLGFPCNQFAGQEPGESADIGEFCQLNYGVSFPMFEKVKVNGDDAHGLFKYLRKEAKGVLGSEKIKWNFTKFLVSKDGKVLKRYAPTDKPEKIAKDIEKILA
ncbi:glutathione peroxidase [Gammaproteobacteria bacterium 45_16_T64]|nr:glutathione peroxidase [Gammaproteobacteria bacterium 45_16_T64]